jgi:hypothetical protein
LLWRKTVAQRTTGMYLELWRLPKGGRDAENDEAVLGSTEAIVSPDFSQQ